MTTIAVIAILATLALGVVGNIRQRADKAKCVSNLKNLYTGAHLYVQQFGSWPQIDYHLLAEHEEKYAQGWIDALKPCGLSYVNWVCPTIQRELGDPDLTDSKNFRVDYIANPFDDRPIAPFEFPTQPWFAERGDPHGEGNLVILTNGQILSLRDLAKRR